MPVTRYRQLQSPVIPDVLNTESGGVQAAQTLADAFDSFSNAGLNIVAGIRSKQGATEGEAAGAAGTPAPRQGMRANTAYGRAYNSAAEAAYSSKMQTDIDASVDEMEQTHEGDLEGFANSVKGYSDGLLKEVPPEYRIRVQQALAARAAAGTTRIRGQAIAQQQDQHTADVLAGQPARVNIALQAALTLPQAEGDAAIASAVAENQAQLDSLVKEHAITAVQAFQWQENFVKNLDKSLSDAKVDGVVDELMDAAGADVEKGDAAMMAIMENPNIADEDKAAVREQYDKRRTALAEDRSRVYAEVSTALAKDLAADEYGPAIEKRARDLYRKGGISLAEYRSSISKATENQMKHVEDTADIAAIQVALQGIRGMDPADPQQRKALNKYIDQAVVQAGMVRGDERWTATMVDVAKKTNILPSQAESWARINMLSGDATQAALGAAFFDRVKDANPAAWDYAVDPKIAPFAEQLNANLAAGIEPTRSYDLAFNNVYGMKEEEKAVLRATYSANTQGLKDNVSALQNAIDDDEHFDPNWRTSSPTAVVAMQGEYNNLVGQYFVSTNGNLDQARKLASQVVLSSYGVNEMNGSREIIKMAPERMYPGMTADVIRTDLAAALKAVDPHIDPTKARIIRSEFTERNKGRVWGVAIYDEDGNRDIVLGPDNQPFQYWLPLGEDFKVAREAVKAAEVTKAIAARAEDLRQRALYDDLGPVLGGPGMR